MKLWQHFVLVMTALSLAATPTITQAKKKPGSTPEYTLVVLAPNGVEITGSLARDLDEFGNVVGYYSDSESDRNGFYYNPSQDSFTLFAPGVEISGLSNVGEMVGTDWVTGKGLYWRSPTDPNPVVLDPLPGHQISYAFKINDAGLILGASQAVQGDGAPVNLVWMITEEGIAAPLELPFPAGETGAVFRLSEQDESGTTSLVGASGILDPYERALHWEVISESQGNLTLLFGPTDLGSLVGLGSAAFDVNVHGDVVGQSSLGRCCWPFLKNAGAAMEPLNVLSDTAFGSASGINDQGTIVGSLTIEKRKGRRIIVDEKAVIWTSPTSVSDLNKKVTLAASERLEQAISINNAGDIVGGGYFPNTTSADYVACLLIRTQ